MGVFRDITERKQAEEKLKDSKASLDGALSAITDVFYVFDTSGKFLIWNETFARVTGYSDQELSSKQPTDFFSGQGVQRMSEAIERIWKDGSTHEQANLVIKDGTQLPYEFTGSILRDGAGNTIGFSGTGRDLSERKRAEEQALIFRRFAEASGQGLGMATLQGQILYMNQTLCRMLDEDNLEDVYKKELSEYYPPEFRERLVNEIFPKVMSGGQWVGELALVSTKGKQTPTIESFFLIRDEEGRPLRLADVITDITERKQMEDDLRKAKEAAEAANRAKSEFLANMSHEIRTPMTAILGYADLLLERERRHACNARTRRHVIKRNGEHLLELINDILDLSKIEAGKMQIEPTRCSPVELVAEVVSLMRVRADAKHLTLETELAGPLPETVLTDPLRLRQVLVNLVGNAIKFTDQGEVRIAVRLTHDSWSLRASAST